jgi:ABC-type sugar transport system substrate-binding protein
VATKSGTANRRVALLLDDPENHYQQLLLREARAAAPRHGAEILDPEFASGSSWTQVESVNRQLRGERPDGLIVILAGERWTRAPFERLVKAGVPVVLLNRLPGWVEELRREHPTALVAGVAPNQQGIGEIQAQQALRLAAPGAFVLLVTGDASSPAAVARRDAFRQTVGRGFALHEVDGRWSEAGAEKALGEWFRIGADRDRAFSLIVCQNDAMAAGARAALAKQAASSGNAALARTPLTGCDGTDQQGKAMVSRGELAATVVMPPTTPVALEVLARYWETAATSGTVLLDAVSHPDLATLRRPA